MCIKTVKMTQKREKPQRGTSMEAWSTKNGVGENGEDEVANAPPCRPNSVVISPLPLIFTKLPLCHSDLQKCHSRPQMLTH